MVDYLAKVQTPGLGWEYVERDPRGDTSQLSWVIAALLRARDAGLDLPEQMLAGAEIWLDQACEEVPADTFEIFGANQFGPGPTHGLDVSGDEKGKVRTYKLKTWYRPPRGYTMSMPAVGLASRFWLGDTRAHPFCIGAANQILENIPTYNEGLGQMYSSYTYTWYYGSLAMIQMGGRYWNLWCDTCLNDVLKNAARGECQDGSWKTPSHEGGYAEVGTVYSTVMATLAFESFYRNPIYLSRSSPPDAAK